MNDLYTDEPEEELRPSKSQKKREMHSVHQLCDDLSRLNTDVWSRLELPSSLVESLEIAARIKSSGARNRQLRHAAKILVVDEKLLIAVNSYFEAQKNQARNEQNRHKLVEQWRDRLLDDEDSLRQLFVSFPATDRQELSTLVRNARKEKRLSKPPAQQCKLFKYLRDFVVV